MSKDSNSTNIVEKDEFGLPILSHDEISKAFQRIDVDNSGYIEQDELTGAFRSLGLPLSYTDFNAFMDACDKDKDGRINLDEFTQFAQNQDSKIRLCFSHLDLDNDAKLSSFELRNGLMQDLHIDISNDELSNFITTINNNKEQHEYISYHTFRNKLLLLPFVNTRAFFESYRHNILIDIGDDSSHTSLFNEVSSKWRDKYNTLVKHDKSQIYTGTNVFISGAVSGAVSRTMTAPMDRMKVMFQSGFDISSHAPAKQLQTAGAGQTESFATQLGNLIKQIYNEGGWKAFWRGNGTNCLKMAPEKAVKLQTYEMFKNIFCKDIDNPTPTERFIAGGASGLTAQTMIYPLEITKTRLALSNVGQYRGIFDCMKHIYKSGGIKSLYNGWNASVLGIVPYAGVELTLYNIMKEQVSKYRQNKYKTSQLRPPSALEILGIGSLASVAGQCVAYPLQVMRTKLQSQGQVTKVQMSDGTVLTIKGENYKNLLDCGKHILINEGIGGFYRGILVNFMKSIPATGISFVVFEQSKELFKAAGV